MSQSRQKPQDLNPEQVTAVAGQAAVALKDKKAPLKHKLIILASAALLISPVDLLPELILGPIGLIDDAGYLAAGVTWTIFALRHKAMGVVSGGGDRGGLPLNTP